MLKGQNSALKIFKNDTFQPLVALKITQALKITFFKQKL